MTEMSVKIGCAGLTADHHRRWATGVSSLADIGRELGVSRQTVHEALRSRGWTKLNHQKAIPAAREAAQAIGSSERYDDCTSLPVNIQPPQNDPEDDPTSERVSILTDVQRVECYKAAGMTTLQAGLAILAEAKGILDRDKGRHSPIGLLRIAEAFERAGRLVLPFLLDDPNKSDRLTEMTIRILSKEEEDKIQADLAKIHGGNVCDTESDVRPPPPKNNHVPDELALRPRLQGPLPDRSRFPEWLAYTAQRFGMRSLRDIATALGADVGYGIPKAELIAAILHRTGGDPQRLTDVSMIVE